MLLPGAATDRAMSKPWRPTIGSEITFEVSEDEVDCETSASTLGYRIHTEGETIEELRQNVNEAVDCYCCAEI